MAYPLRLYNKSVSTDTKYTMDEQRKRGTGTAIMEAKMLMQLHYRLDVPLFMIFIDLKKAYDTLDRTQAERILKKYGVGPNVIRFIKLIWEGDTMVPRQSGYFGRQFRASRGVRQGDISSPVIFNIMVDAVLRYHKQKLHRTGEKVDPIFYADDGLLAGTDEILLQRSLDIITEGFASIGLKMNAVKTEFMVATGSEGRTMVSSNADMRRNTGIGLSHAERRKVKVICPKCGTEVSSASLVRHQSSQKCKKFAKSFHPTTPQKERVRFEKTVVTPMMDPTTYQVSIPNKSTETDCPHPGCCQIIPPARTTYQMRQHLRKHFRGRHPRDTIIIDEEGQLPQCTKCGLFSKSANTAKHWATSDCIKSSDTRNRWFRQHFEKPKAKKVDYFINGQKIDKVTEFKYLGRILHEKDDDQYAAIRQLNRAKQKWARISKILTTQGVEPRVKGYFYKAIVQAVLLYGSESWCMTKATVKKFKSFHMRVARYLSGRHIKPLEDGTWLYPVSEEVLEETGLFSIETYIEKRRATIFEYISRQPIYNKCKNSRPGPSGGSRVVWWQQKFGN